MPPDSDNDLASLLRAAGVPMQGREQISPQVRAPVQAAWEPPEGRQGWQKPAAAAAAAPHTGDAAKPEEVKPEEVKPEEVKPEEAKPEEAKPEATPAAGPLNNAAQQSLPSNRQPVPAAKGKKVKPPKPPKSSDK